MSLGRSTSAKAISILIIASTVVVTNRSPLVAGFRQEGAGPYNTTQACLATLPANSITPVPVSQVWNATRGTWVFTWTNWSITYSCSDSTNTSLCSVCAGSA